MQSVITNYEGRVVLGRVVNSIQTPFEDKIIYKVELENWIINKNKQLVEVLYLSKNEIAEVLSC